MFEVAIFTDVRAAEAIDGLDGFNFQAVSQGITAQDKDVIKNVLVHRVKVTWSSINPDPLTHPPSFGYLRREDRYLLARGVSIGRTATGRPGNLLTQAVVTGDAQDFSMMRPAQLFGAVNWDLSKAPSKEIDAWPSPLEIEDDFKPESLREMVLSDPWAVQHLPIFLTMMEQTFSDTPKRLAIISADWRQTQLWIALGTLFVAQDTALRLSIWGQVEDPLYGVDADIVSVSPAFGRTFDAAVPNPAINAIDLDKRVLSPIEPSESAIRQARWFTEEEAGPAIEAIELARRWEPVLGAQLASRTSEIVNFEGASTDQEVWRSSVQSLRKLAEAGQSDELLFYGDSLVDVAMTRLFDSEEDALLSAQATCALIAADAHDLAAALVTSALEAFSDRPELRDAWLEAAAASAERSTQLEWEDAGARAHTTSEMSRHAEQLSPQSTLHLLQILSLLNISLDPATARAVQARLTAEALRVPHLLAASDHLPMAQPILNATIDALVTAWRRGDDDALSQLRAGAWDWLPPRVPAPLTSTVVGWLTARDLARLPISERTEQLRRAAYILETWHLVWEDVTIPADLPLLRIWFDRSPTVSDDAAEWLADKIHDYLQSGRNAVTIRSFLQRYSEGAKIQPGTRLGELIAESARIADLATQAGLATDPAPARQFARAVARTPNLYQDLLGDVVLFARNQMDAIVSITEVLGEEWPAAGIEFTLRKRRKSDAGQLARCVCAALKLRSHDRELLTAVTEEFLLSVIDDRRALRSVKEHLGASERSQLEALAKESQKGRLRRSVKRALPGLLARRRKDQDG